jgi:hypothetical protein
MFLYSVRRGHHPDLHMIIDQQESAVIEIILNICSSQLSTWIRYLLELDWSALWRGWHGRHLAYIFLISQSHTDLTEIQNTNPSPLKGLRH